MDLLTDVLSTLRLRGVVHGRADLSAPWGFHSQGSCSQGACSAEFYAVTHGEAYLEMSASGASVHLQSGDLVILPEGDAVALRDRPGGVATVSIEHVAGACPPQDREVSYGGGGERTSLIMGYFDFEDDPTNPFLQSLPPLLHVDGSESDVADWLDTTLRLLDSETTAPHPGAELTTARLAEVLFIQAVRTYVAHLPDACPEERSVRGFLYAMKDPQIGRALAAFHRAPLRAWTVAELAEQALMSRTAFATRFTELMGTPPMQHVTEWRLDRARKLLHRDASATVAEAAAAAGYESLSSFTKAFKRETGHTPGAYREQAHAIEGVRLN